MALLKFLLAAKKVWIMSLFIPTLFDQSAGSHVTKYSTSMKKCYSYKLRMYSIAIRSRLLHICTGMRMAVNIRKQFQLAIQ